MIPLVFWLSILFVFYTYIIYPLLIAVLARVKVRRVKFSEVDTPNITLLIAAYNEESIISEKIENSLSLDYPREKIQILIAADGSSDSTPAIVEKYADRGVELNYVAERSGKIVAMNRAVERARGDIIVFSDANNMYEPEAIRKLIAPFSDPEVGASTGSKLIIQDGSDLGTAEGIYWRYESWIKKNETAFSSCIGAVGEILAVRRDLYVPPPNNVINDDYFIVLELLKRSFRVCYVPDAKSFEYASIGEKDEIIRRARMTTGKYQAMFEFINLLPFKHPVLLWQIISHKYFRAFLPFGFIGIFMANVLVLAFPSTCDCPSILILSSPFGWVFLLLQLIFYGLAFVGSTIKLSGWIGKLLYIPTYLVNSNIAVLKGMYGFLTKKQTNIWERVRRDVA